jgi:hypothetical protein
MDPVDDLFDRMMRKHRVTMSERMFAHFTKHFGRLDAAAKTHQELVDLLTSTLDCEEDTLFIKLRDLMVYIKANEAIAATLCSAVKIQDSTINSSTPENPG